MTYFTNPTYTSANPEDARNGWKKCFYSRRALGKEFAVVCELNRSTYTPLTRQFAIRIGYHLGVGLREVQVFGFGKFADTIIDVLLLSEASSGFCSTILVAS